MVRDLIRDLRKCPEISQILVTNNIPGPVKYGFSEKVKIRINDRPLGYGANHNRAFEVCRTPFFCVINPDIRIHKNPFPVLLQSMKEQNVGVCAPQILSIDNKEEDSHRRFPDLRALLAKALRGRDGKVSTKQALLMERNSWLAGMFLFLRSEAFRNSGGFDDKFFLYYEDVDLCARLIRRGYKVRSVPSVSVIHYARRQSRRDLRYAVWHLQSMARFLWKQLTGFYRLAPRRRPKMIPYH